MIKSFLNLRRAVCLNGQIISRFSAALCGKLFVKFVCVENRAVFLIFFSFYRLYFVGFDYKILHFYLFVVFFAEKACFSVKAPLTGNALNILIQRFYYFLLYAR